jgi:UDP-3-O-[3-hydroxymyristoyl] N-acetylglucosamine deacetylase
MEVTYTRCVQRTLCEPVVVYREPGGDGRLPATMLIRPAPPDTGIRFVRSDAPGGPCTLYARVEYLGTNGSSATLECPNGIGIGAVGPLLVGLAACGIDNAEITLDCAEAVMPYGGAAALVEALESGGAEEQARPLRVIRIERPIAVEDGCRRAMLRPSNVPHAAISVDAENGSGRHRWLAVGLGEELLRELIRSLACCNGRSTGSEPLRRALLDCIGYLEAAGAPILGHFLAQNPDPELMHRLVHALAGQRGSWSLVEVGGSSAWS